MPLVSPRNRSRQALSRCSGFFDLVFSKTPGTQTDILPDAGVFPEFSVFLATAASSLCISKIRRTDKCRMSTFGAIDISQNSCSRLNSCVERDSRTGKKQQMIEDF